MSIVLRQSKAGGSGSGSSSATSSGVGFASNTLANSLLVCVVWATGSSVAAGTLGITAPVTSGFTWTLAVAAAQWNDPSGPNRGKVSIFYIAGAGAMATTTTTAVGATETGTSPTCGVEFSLYEFTGVATSSPLETSSSAVDSTGSSTDPAPGSLTTSNTDLILSCYQCESASNLAANTSAGFTLGVNAASETTGQTQYILNEASGTIVTSWPSTQAYWAAATVAFKPNGPTVTVTPSGVSITSGVNSPSPSATATVTPSGVSITSAINTPVIAIFDGIDFGNVVSTSGAIPSGVNSTYFYMRAVGYIVPSVTGQYTLGVNSKDGCNLYLAGQPVFPANLTALQSANSSLAYTQSGTIMLTAGVYYPVVLEWQHGSGTSYECQLLWTPPSGSVAVIPPTNLSTSATSLTQTIHTTWWNGTSSLWYPTGHASVDLTNQSIPNTPLDSNGQVSNQLKCKPLYAVQTFSSTNPLSQSGTTKTILVAASTINWGSNAVNYNSGSVTPALYSTYYVYADDPTFAGGAVTYQSTTNQLVVYQNDGRVSFGSITTASGGGGTGGGGTCFSPNTKVKTQRGDVSFWDIREDDFALTARGTWRRILQVRCSEHTDRPMLNMGDDELVTLGHLFKHDGWTPAKDMGFGEELPYTGLIANLCIETEEDDDGSGLDTEHSYTLANGHVVHNMPQGTT